MGELLGMVSSRPPSLTQSPLASRARYYNYSMNGLYKTLKFGELLSIAIYQVLHPEQNRLLSVREYARSQGFG